MRGESNRRLTPSEIAGVSTRKWIARAFSIVEDVVYVGLGLLLTGCAVVLLIDSTVSFVQQVGTASAFASTVGLLDRILLIMLVIELLYTVQVSFREHAVVPEPFLLVGLIAAIRRVLLLTAEFSQVRPLPEPVFRHFVIELAVLTVLIISLAFSLLLLRKRGVVSAERA
jgi:phosphate starvation-inducible membrane PsiE